MVHTTKLAMLRGRRIRISSATNGSRRNAIITASIAVMKNRRPKYRIATTTPTAIVVRARFRDSPTALFRGLPVGLVISATAQRRPSSRMYHGGVYNEIELTPPYSRILALDLGRNRIGLAISDPLGITAQ